jgi:hypothetical protein
MENTGVIANRMRPMLDASTKMLNDMLEASKIVAKEYKNAGTLDAIMMGMANHMVMRDIEIELALRN